MVRQNVKDVGMQELLVTMLQPSEDRPTADALLQHPILQFFEYIIKQNVTLEDESFREKVTDRRDTESVLPALISALQLGDKNKAIISFFGLMRILMQSAQNEEENREESQSMRLKEAVLSLILRQEAYIQMVELLVICMKEYSVSQSTYLAPQGRDQFADLYAQALEILTMALKQSEEQFEYDLIQISPQNMRRQFYLAGFLSLTMLLCEQVSRIAIKTSEAVHLNDARYLELILDLLAQFVEQASPTALIAAEKAGLVANLLKMVQVEDPNYLPVSTRDAIMTYLGKASSLMPVSILREISQTLTMCKSSRKLLSLKDAPTYQMVKQIYRKFFVETLVNVLIKQTNTTSQSCNDLKNNTRIQTRFNSVTFEHDVTKLVYFLSINRTLQLANAFQLCTESLRLVNDIQSQGLKIKYDFGYTCHTCTKLLKGLTNYAGPRVLNVCYSCAQLCHSKHKIEPIGYLGEKWNGCNCMLVQGFQVSSNSLQTLGKDEEEDESAANENLIFHTCKARYETLNEGQVRSEINQPQLLLDSKVLYQERMKLQASGLIHMSILPNSVRKSDLITVLKTDKSRTTDLTAADGTNQTNEKQNWAQDFVVYTTESFEVVSICSQQALSQLQNPAMLETQPVSVQAQPSLFSSQKNNNVTSPAHTEQTGILSPVEPKNFKSRTAAQSSQYSHKKTGAGGSSNLRGSIEESSADKLLLQNQNSLSSFEEGQPDRIRAYFEVKIILGGFYDQIAIGLTNSADFPTQDVFIGYTEGSIAYHADDGKCFINGDYFEYGSPYGSQTTVGCGYTQGGDVFFTRDGFQLPMIKSSQIWPVESKSMLESQNQLLLYPVVSMRGKLTTIKVNFSQYEDFVFKTPIIKPELENPAINVIMDKTMLKFLVSELPKSQSQAILEALKSCVGRKLRASTHSQGIQGARVSNSRVLHSNESQNVLQIQNQDNLMPNQNELHGQLSNGSEPTRLSLIDELLERLQAFKGNGSSQVQGNIPSGKRKGSIQTYQESQATIRQSSANNVGGLASANAASMLYNSQSYATLSQTNIRQGNGSVGSVSQQPKSGLENSRTGLKGNNLSSKMRLKYPQSATTAASQMKFAQPQIPLKKSSQYQGSNVRKKTSQSPRSRLKQSSSLSHISKGTSRFGVSSSNNQVSQFFNGKSSANVHNQTSAGSRLHNQSTASNQLNQLGDSSIQIGNNRSRDSAIQKRTNANKRAKKPNRNPSQSSSQGGGSLPRASSQKALVKAVSQSANKTLSSRMKASGAQSYIAASNKGTGSSSLRQRAELESMNSFQNVGNQGKESRALFSAGSSNKNYTSVEQPNDDHKIDGINHGLKASYSQSNLQGQSASIRFAASNKNDCNTTVNQNAQSTASLHNPMYSFSAKQMMPSSSSSKILPPHNNSNSAFSSQQPSQAQTQNVNNKRLSASNTAKTIKNSNQLILIGSGQTVSQSQLLSLTKQGSQESFVHIADRSSSNEQVPLAQTNYFSNSSGNPSFFQGQQPGQNIQNRDKQGHALHYQSAKTLKTITEMATTSTHNYQNIQNQNQLVQPTKNLQANLKSNQNYYTQRNQQHQRHAGMSPTSVVYTEMPSLKPVQDTISSSNKGSGRRTEKSLASPTGVLKEAYVDQVIVARAGQATTTERRDADGQLIAMHNGHSSNNQNHNLFKGSGLGDNNSIMLDNQAVQNQSLQAFAQTFQALNSGGSSLDQRMPDDSSSFRIGKQKSLLESIASQNTDQNSSLGRATAAGPSAFYQALSHSAQVLPRNQNATATRKAASSRVTSSQVNKPAQNVSTNMSNCAPASTDRNTSTTKAHQLKTSNVKVPKPRLTSALASNKSTTALHYNQTIDRQSKLLYDNANATNKSHFEYNRGALRSDNKNKVATSNLEGWKHDAKDYTQEKKHALLGGQTQANNRQHQPLLKASSSHQALTSQQLANQQFANQQLASQQLASPQLGHLTGNLQHPKVSKLNFYPQVAAPREISVPNSDLNVSDTYIVAGADQAAANAAQGRHDQVQQRQRTRNQHDGHGSGRSGLDYSRSSYDPHQRRHLDANEQDKNCSIF